MVCADASKEVVDITEALLMMVPGTSQSVRSNHNGSTDAKPDLKIVNLQSTLMGRSCLEPNLNRGVDFLGSSMAASACIGQTKILSHYNTTT